MVMPCPTEAQEADTLMQYMKVRGIKFTHIKNETGRAIGNGRMVNMKAVWDARDGVSPGFPDFMLVLPGIGLLAIELKRVRLGKVSPKQAEWIEALQSCPGVEARVCKGAEASIAFIEEFYPVSNIVHTEF
jgi:hypothetical protein